ncbi:MAG: gliding motility-associated C-terminal domain-containing protein [Crocinitomicaceae bacterium]
MKKFSLIILAFIMSTMNVSFAQTVVASANPTSFSCGGGNVDLSAVGTSTTPVFGDDFNTGSVAPGWSASPAAQFDNPCGASVDGSTYLWMGPTTAAPREMTTAPVDVSCGGTVCFDFKFICESCGDSSPCEGADTYAEGVSLQYSTDGGATWIDFAYFAPNGDLLTAYPGNVYSPYASGTTPFTSWNNYCFTIPAGAETATTMFQLHQWGSSGTNYDHWGIDNFYVYANPCAPFYYDWLHIPGAPDSPDVTTNITQTTTFEVCYTNGIVSVCDQVTVTVETIDITGLTIGTEPCLGDNTGTISVTVNGGAAPYTYTLAGPTPGSNGTGNFNNLAPGNYTLTVNDNGSCVADSSFTIPPGPACCTLTATGTDLTCFNNNSGTTTAHPANGVAPYSYQWDAAAGNQTTQTATGLAAGTYSVTITDFNGCTSTASVTIGQPTALNAGATPTDPTCFGVCNGQIVVSAPTGGTSPYEYNLNGGTFGGSGTFTGLCDGNYNVIVQDDNGCQFPISNIAINEPTDLTLTQQSVIAATCGAANGELVVAAGGGTTNYQYDIGGAQQASGTFSGLTSGTYTVTVTDANGCTETLNVNIPSSAGPVPFIDVSNNVTCNGGLSGSVTVGVTGGTTPLTYYLDPPSAGQAGNTFNSVSAGTHTIEVVDANGCSGTVDVTLTEPTALNYSVVKTDASCNNLCDGEIDITASGANPPYEYSDDNGLTFQTSNVLTGLCAGTINVVVRDANGCLANSTVNITEPTALTLAPTFTEPSCYGSSDGTITFNGGGATPAYEYSIDNGTTFSTSDPVTGVAAGDYDLVIEDANGCQETTPLTVTQPPAFNFNYLANNPSNCGANDGSFEIAALNGLAPYQYSINGPSGPFQGTGYFPNLYSGLYTLYVIDDNGCADSVYEALSDNVMVGYVNFQQDATCYNDCNGVVEVAQNFGAAPYTYTLSTTGVSQVNNGFFLNLCAGTHYVTIEDDGLCIEIVQVDITHPDSILFDAALTDITCPDGVDGEITIQNESGGDGGPYTYSIDGVNFQASPTFGGLTSGIYTLWTQDGQGCLGSAEFTLTEPAPWDIVINQTDLTCYQNNTGFVQVVASGSTSPYSYDLGGTVNGTGIFSGLAANVAGYPITVTDDNGCTFDTSKVVNEPAELTAGYTLEDALCFGAADGQITVAAAGGTTPYLYSSNNGVTQQSNPILSGLAAGCYDVHVEDNNNCVAISNQCIGEPTEVTMTLVTSPATCGLNNAEVTITANNGTPGYQYSNDGGATFQAGNSFTGLAPTNYTLVVEDNNGCQIDSLITLTADNQPQIDNIVKNNPLCFGNADGDITITSSGGVGAHQYSIDNGVTFQAAATFNGLVDGTYDVVVEDANGCQATTTVTLTHPTLLTLNSVPTHLTCNGNSSGEIIITANGGTSPYDYSIDNGATFQGGGTFSFIAANTYDLVVEDANGCIATGTETVTEPNALVWTDFTINHPICFGSCDGEVLTTTFGGTGAYNYNWSGNIAASGSQNATGVCAGTYSVTLTDANGCQLDSNNFVLTNPPAMQIDNVVANDLLCYNDNTGEIIITAATAIDFAIDGPVVQNNATGNFTNLPIGNYDITVTDADGCTAISNTTLYQPDSLYSIAPSNWPACYGETVTIQAFTNGGTVPYQTFEWTNDQNGNVETNAIFDYVVFDTIEFTYQVTDANGCQTVPVSYTVMPSPPLVLAPSPDTMICIGEEVDLSVVASGGELIDFGAYLGYSYSWDTGNPQDTLEMITVSPVTPTDYTVTVTDQCGQVVDTTITVGIHPDPIVDILATVYGCEPDTFDFDMSANVQPGYSIFWDFGNGQTSTNPNPTDVIYQNAGTYDITVTIVSDEGCTITETSIGAVVINENPIPGFYYEPDAPTIMDPTIQIVDYSENAVSYTYTFGEFGTSSLAEPSFTFPVEDEATIEVCQYIVSVDNCTAEVCVPVLIQEIILFYVPNVFTPDGDSFNENFKPVFTGGVDPYDYHLTIFNRWGEIIFESHNYDQGWNGHYGNGGLVQDGVYIWQIEFGEKYSDDKQTHRGHVTVLK